VVSLLYKTEYVTVTLEAAISPKRYLLKEVMRYSDKNSLSFFL